MNTNDLFKLLSIVLSLLSVVISAITLGLYIASMVMK